MTTGCLTALIALIIVLGTVVSWLWFRNWHDENANGARDRKALASVLRQARATADGTARALDASGTTDADAVTAVIWRHSEAPVITYDPSRREFTATAEKFAQYDEEGVLGGGPVRETRCFVFTYARHSGQGWTSKVAERDRASCGPGNQIGGRVRLALTRISGMYAEDMTRPGMQDALDPTGRRSFDVKSVVREGGTMRASILVSSAGAEVDQCYRFTRPVPDDDGGRPATAVPVSSC
ncbi:hypothetical protein ACVNF4_03145 [Streptomyces sp. S6]